MRKASEIFGARAGAALWLLPRPRLCQTLRLYGLGRGREGHWPGVDAAWEAANATMQTFGGYSYDAEYDVERKFRETRLFQVASISRNLILSYVGEHVLGLPRSF